MSLHYYISEEELVLGAIGQVTAYRQRFPLEAESMRHIDDLLRDFGAEAFSRANAVGHVTTSGLVYDSQRDQVLLIHHRVLNRWLQPGGHYEGSTPLHVSAAREVEEETGVVVAFPQNCSPSDFLIDIDTHGIPPNDAKGEGAHEHHDFLYLFEGDASQPLNPQWVEVRGARWVPSDHLTQLGSERLGRVWSKIAARAKNS